MLITKFPPFLRPGRRAAMKKSMHIFLTFCSWAKGEVTVSGDFSKDGNNSARQYDSNRRRTALTHEVHMLESISRGGNSERALHTHSLSPQGLPVGRSQYQHWRRCGPGPTSTACPQACLRLRPQLSRASPSQPAHHPLHTRVRLPSSTYSQPGNDTPPHQLPL